MITLEIGILIQCNEFTLYETYNVERKELFLP